MLIMIQALNLTTLLFVLLSICNTNGETHSYGTYDFEVVNSKNVSKAYFEKTNVELQINLIYSSSKPSQYNLTCKLDYLKVAQLVNWTDHRLNLKIGENETYSFNVTIYPKRLGGSYLKCSLNNTSSLDDMINVFKVIVKRKQTIAELIFRVVVIFFLIFITFVMGCGLDRQVILSYLKKPVAPAIGFCSQYMVMPLVAFGVAKLTNIDNAFGLGLLTIGCSPGGGASNIWSVLLNGELNLSMTMTFISTVAALGMMPLWLFILGRFFVDPTTVKIPYGNIMLNLLQIVVPVGLGMLFRYKFSKQAIWLAKKVKLLGLFFIIFVMTFGVYANFYIYKLMGDYLYLLPIGACLPWLGFLFGGAFGFITRMSRAKCITIALETGCQNIGVAILILKFSIPQPGGDLGATMPIIVAIFTPFPLYIAYIILLIYRRCCKKKSEDKDKERDVEMSQTDKDNNPINDEEIEKQKRGLLKSDGSNDEVVE